MRILTNKTLEMEAMVGARQETIRSQEAIIRSQQEKLKELQVTVENFRSKADMFDGAQAQMKVSLCWSGLVSFIQMVLR